MNKLVATTALAAVMSNAAYAGTVVNSKSIEWFGTALVEIDNHCEFVANNPGKMIFFKDEGLFDSLVLVTGFSTDTERGGAPAYVEMNVKNISYLTVTPAVSDNSVIDGDTIDIRGIYNSYVENVDTGDKYPAAVLYNDPAYGNHDNFVAISNGVTTSLVRDISGYTPNDAALGYMHDYMIQFAPDVVPAGQTATLKLEIGGIVGVKSVNDYDDVVYGGDIADGDYSTYHNISCMQ